MVTNGSKKFPPLSDAFRDVQKEVKLLEKEAKENLKVRKQLLRDLRTGLKTQEQVDELDGKLQARYNEILQTMFELVMTIDSLK